MVTYNAYTDSRNNKGLTGRRWWKWHSWRMPTRSVTRKELPKWRGRFRQCLHRRPSLPQATRDHRNVLYHGASHGTFDPDKIVKCVYSSRNDNFELHYMRHDEERNIDRVDWNTTAQYSAAAYASWKVAVNGRRDTWRPPPMTSHLRAVRPVEHRRLLPTVLCKCA